MRPLLGSPWRELDTTQQYRLLVLLTGIFVTLLVMIVSWVYAQLILNRNTEYIARVTGQYQKDLALEGQKTREFVDAIVYNPTVVSYLTEEDPFERYLYGQQVSTFLAHVKAGRNEVVDIFFLRPNAPEPGFFALSAMQPGIDTALFARSTPDILGAYPYRIATSPGTEETVLMAGCAIYDTAHARAQKLCVGAVAVALDIKVWTRDLAELMALEGISYLLLDARGNRIAGELHCKNTGLTSHVLEIAAQGHEASFSASGYDMTVTALKEMPGSLIICVDNRVMLGDLRRALIYTIGVCLLLMAFLILTYQWILRQVVRPIEALTHFFGNIGAALPQERVRPEGNRDLKQLGETVNTMLDQQEKLTRDLVDTHTSLIASELAMRKAELMHLRSQINPHFIYNTLELIRSIAAIRHVPEIGVAVKSLAHIMRFSLQREDRIPLREELGMVMDYVAIQTLRFRDRISVTIAVSEEAQAARIPRMILQPLVENAYVHGLEQLTGGGVLQIRGDVADGLLRLTIADNGAGMGEAEARALNARLQTAGWMQEEGRQAEPAQAAVLQAEGPQHGSGLSGAVPAQDSPADRSPDGGHGNGIGLANVAQRIRLSGGESCGLFIDSVLDQGTTVTVVLPAHPMSLTNGA